MLLAEVEKLYDHENALEFGALTAIAAYDPDIPVFSRLTLPRQKVPKPRIELGIRVGAATEHERPVNPNWKVRDAFNGQLLLQIVTEPPAQTDTHLPSHDIHGMYRARLRYIVSQFRYSWNVAMTTHVVTMIVDARSDAVLENEDGHEISTLAWDIRFNIRTDAWPVEP